MVIETSKQHIEIKLVKIYKAKDGQGHWVRCSLVGHGQASVSWLGNCGLSLYGPPVHVEVCT
jgi:hypothetical protein